MPVIFKVDGIVAMRDKHPYVRLSADDTQVVQLSIAQARSVALDILQQCARSEADAMIYKFFSENEFSMTAATQLMMEFRNFRLKLDEEEIERTYTEQE